MTDIYQELAERIRGQIPDLDRCAQKALRAWHHLQREPSDSDIALDSVALNLHGFYNGLERIFELLARHVDGQLPSGEAWHQDLLAQMAQDKPSIRPAVIGSASVPALDELLRFRHLVRNVYTHNLLPGKMAPIVNGLPGLWNQVQAELQAFADFLDELAH